MSQLPAEQAATPLARSWTMASLLLVGIGVYAAVFINTLASSGLDNRSTEFLVYRLVFALAVLLTGLMVFAPVRPPAAGVRLTVYLVPSALLLCLIPAGPMELVHAALPPWALLTALYGVRGGLPKGWKFVLLYAGSAVAAFLLVATVWINEAVWLMPVAPLLLLLSPRYRQPKLRVTAELLFAVLLAACIGAEFAILPQGDSWLPYRAVVGTACTISCFYTLALLGLGHYARFDTPGYQTRAERRGAARQARSGIGA
ncbi:MULTISPECIES: hypothetical protein [unclassified Arthrobacter]|uniref:hypothetical protein n=1 Tax=unclassified Arthrobacter TaxID=235627 RepID=UPI0011AFEE99|nr:MULTISPECIES: hypothetical protein [unclassified Arthrobacter]